MRGSLAFAAAYAAAWVPLVVAYAVLIAYQDGGRASAGAAIVGSLASVVPAAVLGVGAWRLGARISVADLGHGRFFAAHTLSAAAYASCWTVAVALAVAIGAPADVLRRFLHGAAGWQWISGLLLYGLLAGIATAAAAGRRANEQQAAAAQADALRVRAELQALRARLDPHFLFNTLHSVTSLLRTHPAAAEAALERFARLLRYVLEANGETRDEVPLAEEWAFVRDYLALEKMRLGKRLRVVEEVDPDALDCSVPLFTLQPLAENAVRHGIAPRAQGGTVRLAARMEGDRLTLEVGDDGAGADPASVFDRPGVGLRVVRQRLAVRYHDRGRLDVTTAPAAGFRVCVTLPAEVAPFSPLAR